MSSAGWILAHAARRAQAVTATIAFGPTHHHPAHRPPAAPHPGPGHANRSCPHFTHPTSTSGADAADAMADISNTASTALTNPRHPPRPPARPRPARASGFATRDVHLPSPATRYNQ